VFESEEEEENEGRRKVEKIRCGRFIIRYNRLAIKRSKSYQ